MALVEQALGNLGEATAHLNEAIDLATDTLDRAALCRTLLALGCVQIRRGHPDQGLATNLEGLRVAERSGNLTEMAHAHIVLGTTLAELGRLEEALHEYSEGDKIARILGNLRILGEASDRPFPRGKSDKHPPTWLTSRLRGGRAPFPRAPRWAQGAGPSTSTPRC